MCARKLAPPGFPVAFAVLTPAAALNIWDGQYDFIFGDLWLLTFAMLATKPVRAGSSAALMTFKPHLGILVAVTMVAHLRIRAALVASLATAIVVAASIYFFGTQAWANFFAITTKNQFVILNRSTEQFYFLMMPSAYLVFGLYGQIVFTFIGLAYLWTVRKVELKTLAFPAATATFLVLPYSFNYDMTVVCLGIAILLWSHWHTLKGTEVLVLILAFNSPQLTFIAAGTVPFILAGALWIQCRIARSDDVLAREAPRPEPFAVPSPLPWTPPPVRRAH